MLVDLLAAMEAAIAEVERLGDQKVQILHHNDADGLSSGAILTRAFEDLNRGRNLVLILDHHRAELPTDDRVHLLDPEIFGLRGDRDITASTTCFLFARTLDSRNRDLARVATIGAVGDRFFVDGRLAGPNREAALETQRQGLLEIEDEEHGETYTLITSSGPIDCSAFARNLDTFGGAGYYRGGPEVGIAVCLDGPTRESNAKLSELREVQERAFYEEVKRIRRDGWRQTEHIQWLHVHDRFEPMGVKMIGAFLDAIRNTEDVDPGRYLAGFQIIPNQVPGIGEFEFDQVKISMRVADPMEEGIRSGDVLGLDILLPEATAQVDGFSDACHSLTAATTVAVGREEELIEQMERILTAQTSD
jgi:hypothetical protein